MKVDGGGGWDIDGGGGGGDGFSGRARGVVNVPTGAGEALLDPPPLGECVPIQLARVLGPGPATGASSSSMSKANVEFDPDGLDPRASPEDAMACWNVEPKSSSLSPSLRMKLGMRDAATSLPSMTTSSISSPLESKTGSFSSTSRALFDLLCLSKSLCDISRALASSASSSSSLGTSMSKSTTSSAWRRAASSASPSISMASGSSSSSSSSSMAKSGAEPAGRAGPKD